MRRRCPGTPIDPTLPLVVAAVDDLAGRLGIEPDEVTVVDARAVTWPDGSLGCPEPGMMYTQVLVDGTLVVLEAGGRRYEYHGGDPLFLCENPQAAVRRLTRSVTATAGPPGRCRTGPIPMRTAALRHGTIVMSDLTIVVPGTPGRPSSRWSPDRRPAGCRVTSSV